MTSWNNGIPMSDEAKRKNAETYAAKRAAIIYTEKACNKCGGTKLLEDFPPRKANKDGRHSSCRSCEVKRKSKYKWTRDQWWEYDIKRQYGINKVEYDAILESQNHSCAVCGIHVEDYKGTYGKGKKVEKLSVDHCHKTNKVRGLLCFRCNLAIGYAQDDPTILENAASYIRERQ